MPDANMNEDAGRFDASLPDVFECPPGQSLRELHQDFDNDTYTSETKELLCSGETPPLGYVFEPSKNIDCDDNNGSVFRLGRPLIDNDGDTFFVPGQKNACVGAPLDETLLDCNDNDASIYPNANETCDGVDNNCNISVDEDEVCDEYECSPIRAIGHSAFAYLQCDDNLEFGEARLACASIAAPEGTAYILAVFEDIAAETQAVIDVMANGQYWIGLNDIGNEDTFQWERPGVPDIVEPTRGEFPWRGREPSNSGFNGEDCVELEKNFVGNTGWNDEGCGQNHGFICERYRIENASD